MSAAVGPERGSSQTPEFHLGCQTITWDNDRTAKRDYTVKAVADAGYDGIEIGARFLDLDHPEEFKTVLDDCGVRLIALHTGWNPFLDSGADGTGSEVERAIEFGQMTGTPYLVMSGRDSETEFGEGIMDFEACFAYLRQLPLTELWVIAEQWKSSVNRLAPEQSIARNRNFLSALAYVGR